MVAMFVVPSHSRRDERRQHPRVPLRVLVHVVTGDLTRNGGHQLYSENLSPGGVFLLTTRPPQAETRVKLEFRLPTCAIPVRAEGEVAWHQREPSGFAVRFTQISEASRNLIRWTVDNQRSTTTAAS
jgi:uncharacterized protein (TIGR02266 family)